jgi:hypothetical protein
VEVPLGLHTVGGLVVVLFVLERWPAVSKSRQKRGGELLCSAGEAAAVLSMLHGCQPHGTAARIECHWVVSCSVVMQRQECRLQLMINAVRVAVACFVHVV